MLGGREGRGSPAADPFREVGLRRANVRVNLTSSRWTDPERQRPVGDTGRHEPRQLDAITDAEFERALADPHPLRGIAQPTARWAAAFVLDQAGVTRTKALGTERMERKLATRYPGERAPFPAASGSSCGRCSRPRSSRRTAMRSSSISASRRPSTPTRIGRPPTSTTSTSASSRRPSG